MPAGSRYKVGRSYSFSVSRAVDDLCVVLIQPDFGVRDSFEFRAVGICAAPIQPDGKLFLRGDQRVDDNAPFEVFTLKIIIHFTRGKYDGD